MRGHASVHAERGLPLLKICAAVVIEPALATRPKKNVVLWRFGPPARHKSLASSNHDHIAESRRRLQPNGAEPAARDHEHIGQLVRLEWEPEGRTEIEHQSAQAIRAARRLRQTDAINVAGLARDERARLAGNGARLQEGGVGGGQIGQRNKADAVAHSEGAERMEDAVDGGGFDLGHDERLSSRGERAEQKHRRGAHGDYQNAHGTPLARHSRSRTSRLPQASAASAFVHWRPHCCYRQAPRSNGFELTAFKMRFAAPASYG